MKQGLATVLRNEPLKERVYRMEVKVEDSLSLVQPGQFYYIHVNDSTAPLLRRPISIHDVDLNNQQLTFIYRVEGEGTKRLCQKKPGDLIDLLGPLGNGFSDPKLQDKRKVVLIGGGIGIPPLYYLGKHLIEKEFQVTSLLGFQSKQESFLIDEFLSLGETRIATIDGSLGIKGTVLDLIHDQLDDWQVFYSCGPKGMLRAIQQKYFFDQSIEGYLSLEERMGCGIGACYGCVVKVDSNYDPKGYKKVCSDGPVFPFREVIL
ncbi:dihydroorotate dehydrogenase electron transfer subunit [Tepidibacillus fermentans]|uniref:Dihydroorotate dehydrogenase B (NAD(+)), electron transfer subunit n=1 Tax=Tepidibacillus fermentans TaxID=1281767 RepID=A0A4R3KKH6_9BACI|nr:dihydroorotate dehydrogenase electron transfer subunit [Tepidibacillus fermentans]TCS84383.1 dihydroorotate dehydrogenase electron transfer subunit [Tepidibacillus fermentans]